MNRSTCLTLALALLATTATGQLPKLTPKDRAITDCLNRARPALLSHLKTSKGNVLALVCLAALHDELPRDHKVLKPALRRLRRTVLRGTYGAALRLMVRAHSPDAFAEDDLAVREARIAADVKRILKNRFHGGFTYAKRNGYHDLSNTQYAALGLRAAHSLGSDVEPEIWKRIMVSVLAMQSENGGFGYTVSRRRRHPYASMTVAGIAVLQICKQRVTDVERKKAMATRAKHKGKRIMRTVDQALALAWRWLGEHKLEIGSDRTLSCLYFHYGLERAAILSDVTTVDERDWYHRGAQMLLDMQDKKRGSWRSSWEIRPGGLAGPGSPVDTGFALLFLRRKFRKTLPPQYPRMSTLSLQATSSEIEAAARRAVRNGPRALPDIIKALRSDIAARRGAASIAIVALAGRDFGYDPKHDPKRSAAVVKVIERWWLERKKTL